MDGVAQITELMGRENISDSYMLLAKQLSFHSPMRHQLGAVIVRKNKVIGTGFNTYKSHPRFGTNRNDWRYMHAEAAALYSCTKQNCDPRGASLYIYRRYGQLSKPCDSCLSLCDKHGISEIHYTEDGIMRYLELEQMLAV